MNLRQRSRIRPKKPTTGEIHLSKEASVNVDTK
jgi:hypothetical protein